MIGEPCGRRSRFSRLKAEYPNQRRRMARWLSLDDGRRIRPTGDNIHPQTSPRWAHITMISSHDPPFLCWRVARLIQNRFDVVNLQNRFQCVNRENELFSIFLSSLFLRLGFRLVPLRAPGGTCNRTVVKNSLVVIRDWVTLMTHEAHVEFVGCQWLTEKLTNAGFNVRIISVTHASELLVIFSDDRLPGLAGHSHGQRSLRHRTTIENQRFPVRISSIR